MLYNYDYGTFNTYPGECGGSVIEHQTPELEVGFETYLSRVVSLSKTLYSPKVLVIPRKGWLCPDMTEKLLTGTLNLNTNKQTNTYLLFN